MPESNDEQGPVGFANLHYPGVAADPSEGRTAIDAVARWRFAEQIQCIGEDAQRTLLGSSVFIVNASPLGVAVAKRLMSFGFGRVGLFGDRTLTGACALGPHDDQAGDKATLPSLLKWSRQEAPWTQFESFCAASIDRSLGDMARGFQILVGIGDAKSAGETLALAHDAKLPLLLAHVSARRGWCAAIAPQSVCENCLEVPVIDNVAEAGVYYPLVEYAATWVATMAIDVTTDKLAAPAFVESFDTTPSPWMRDTREARPKSDCAKCFPAK